MSETDELRIFHANLDGEAADDSCCAFMACFFDRFDRWTSVQKKFASNTIQTTKYSLLTFFPLNLFDQVSRFHPLAMPFGVDAFFLLTAPPPPSFLSATAEPHVQCLLAHSERCVADPAPIPLHPRDHRLRIRLHRPRQHGQGRLRGLHAPPQR